MLNPVLSGYMPLSAARPAVNRRPRNSSLLTAKVKEQPTPQITPNPSPTHQVAPKPIENLLTNSTKVFPYVLPDETPNLHNNQHSKSTTAILRYLHKYVSPQDRENFYELVNYFKPFLEQPNLAFEHLDTWLEFLAKLPSMHHEEFKNLFTNLTNLIGPPEKSQAQLLIIALKHVLEPKNFLPSQQKLLLLLEGLPNAHKLKILQLFPQKIHQQNFAYFQDLALELTSNYKGLTKFVLIINLIEAYIIHLLIQKEPVDNLDFLKIFSEQTSALLALLPEDLNAQKLSYLLQAFREMPIKAAYTKHPGNLPERQAFLKEDREMILQYFKELNEQPELCLAYLPLLSYMSNETRREFTQSNLETLTPATERSNILVKKQLLATLADKEIFQKNQTGMSYDQDNLKLIAENLQSLYADYRPREASSSLQGLNAKLTATCKSLNLQLQKQLTERKYLTLFRELKDQIIEKSLTTIYEYISDNFTLVAQQADLKSFIPDQETFTERLLYQECPISHKIYDPFNLQNPNRLEHPLVRYDYLHNPRLYGGPELIVCFLLTQRDPLCVPFSLKDCLLLTNDLPPPTLS